MVLEKSKTRSKMPENVKPYLLRIPKEMYDEIQKIGKKNGHVVNKQMLLIFDTFLEINR